MHEKASKMQSKSDIQNETAVKSHVTEHRLTDRLIQVIRPGWEQAQPKDQAFAISKKSLGYYLGTGGPNKKV